MPDGDPFSDLAGTSGPGAIPDPPVGEACPIVGGVPSVGSEVLPESLDTFCTTALPALTPFDADAANEPAALSMFTVPPLIADAAGETPPESDFGTKLTGAACPLEGWAPALCDDGPAISFEMVCITELPALIPLDNDVDKAPAAPSMFTVPLFMAEAVGEMVWLSGLAFLLPVRRSPFEEGVPVP